MRRLAIPAAYLLAAAVLATSFPLALAVFAATAPFDPDRMAVSEALRRLGTVFIRTSPLWRVELEGALPPPPATFVVVPNHRSLVDALAVAFLPRNMKWIGKRSVFAVPWLGWAFRLAGYVPVRRGDRASGRRALARMRRYLDRGIPVGLFAEGTRSRGGELRPFKAGPFKLAIEAGVPIVPVAIEGAGRALPPDRLAVHRARIRVRILAPIPTRGLAVGDVDRLRAAVRAALAGALPPA